MWQFSEIQLSFALCQVKKGSFQDGIFQGLNSLFVLRADALVFTAYIFGTIPSLKW